MARTVSYNDCLGSRANPLSFTNFRIVDLRNGQSQYLSTIKQLMDALPKTEDPSPRFALQGHIARPGQKRLRRSMRAVIWWLLPSDGIFRRASNSLRYFLTRQGQRVVLQRGDVAYPPYNSHFNWVFDPAPPPSRDHGDLTSPAPSRDHGIQPSGKENTPPQNTPRKLPRKLRPRRRKEKQPGSTANHNSPIWKAGRETQCEPAANQNSPSWEAGREMQPGSMTNHNLPSREPGNQPGTSGSPRSAMRAPVKHPLTIQRSHLSQPPMMTANHNSGHRFDPDHPESGRLYKPAGSSIQQDSALRSRRDSFSGFDLSSPTLQRSHRESFSGSPAGQLHKRVSLTDPTREARIAGGLRPGPVQPHPRAACPDTGLAIDAAPPEAAAVSLAERSPTVLDIPETGQTETTRCPEPSHRLGSRSPRRHSRKRPRNRSSALHRPKKCPSHPGRWCE